MRQLLYVMFLCLPCIVLGTNGTEQHVCNRVSRMSADQFAQNHDVTPEKILHKLHHTTETEDDMRKYLTYRSLHRLQERCKQMSSSKNTPPDAYYSYMDTCIRNNAGGGPIQPEDVFSCFVPRTFQYDKDATQIDDTVSVFGIFGQIKGFVTGTSMFINRTFARENPIHSLYTIEHELTHQEQGFSDDIINEEAYLQHMGKPNIEFDADREAARYIPLPCMQAQEYESSITQLLSPLKQPASYASSAQKHAWLIQRCHTETSHEECERQGYLFSQYKLPIWRTPEFLASTAGIVGTCIFKLYNNS